MSDLQKNYREPENGEKFENHEKETCPVCWGHQQYDGKIRVLYKDKQVDVNNHRSKYMRIQKLLKDTIEGYKLKKGEIHTCPSCGTKQYKR